jgi:hypothetical protein
LKDERFAFFATNPRFELPYNLAPKFQFVEIREIRGLSTANGTDLREKYFIG